MIRLFPRDSVCGWCGGDHPQAQLCSARPGLTRRSFLCLAGAAAAAAVIAPKLLVSAPPPSSVLTFYGIPVTVNRDVPIGILAFVYDGTYSRHYHGIERAAWKAA